MVFKAKIKCEKSEFYFYHSSRGSWNFPTSRTWSLLRNSFIQSRYVLLTFKLNPLDASKFRSSLYSSGLKKFLFNCKTVAHLRHYFFSVFWLYTYPQHIDMQRIISQKVCHKILFKIKLLLIFIRLWAIFSFFFLECLLKFSFNFHWWYH